jgi:ligand-binding sensor domain-containing protein/signal transduction histidine kinase
MLALAGALATESPVLAQSQQRDAPVHQIDGSCIREWLVLGPFPSTEMESELLALGGGEASVRPREGDTVSTKDGKRLTWTRLRSPQDLVNLEGVFGIQDGATAYAYCELQSERFGEGRVRVVANDATVVRLNGQAARLTADRVGSSGDRPLLALPLKGGRNTCLVKLKGGDFEWNFLFQPLPLTGAIVELQVADPGRVNGPGALVQFYSNGQVAARLETDESGRAAAFLYPLAESYDLRVTSRDLGTWLFNLMLKPGERRRLDLRLTNAVSIDGQVRALDGSGQSAVVVQAIRVSDSQPAGEQIKSPLPLPSFSETVLSDTNGNFRFVNLRPGQYQLRAHESDGFVGPEAGSGADADPPATFTIRPGQTRQGIRFQLPEVKKGVWKNHPIAHGLREVHPTSIHGTPNGLLWIGTDESVLQVYDGVEFKTMASAPEIPANEILALGPAANGALWVGTSRGMVQYAQERIHRFSFNETLERKTVNDILVDKDGTVWFATSSGLCRFGGGKWVRFSIADGLPGNVIHSLLRGRDGLLWLATSFGLVRFEGRIFTLMPAPHELFGRGVKRLREARDGAIWFATSHGAYRYDGQVYSRLGVEDGLISGDISDIAETSEGALWFATAKGLSKFNGSNVVNYTAKDGLSNEWVRRIYVDSDDVLWCANGWGISRFDPKGFIGFGGRDGLGHGSGETTSVLAVAPDPDGSIWIGTAWAGVFRIQGRKLQSLSSAAERHYVRQIHRAADGTVWFGGQPFGIAKHEAGRLVPVLKREWVIALCSDLDGNLWFGQGWKGGGLSRYNPKTGEAAVFTTAQGLPSDEVWSVAQSSAGGIWVGTGEGLARVRNGEIEDFRRQLGVPTGEVFNLRSDAEEALWIGSRLGLHRWKGGERVSITASNGLPDQHIWCSARTADGIIWMGTDTHGLLGYDGQAVTVIDKRDGLLGNQVLCLAAEADGSLLAGFLDGGLSRYHPAKTPPSVRLSSIQLNDQVVSNFSNVPKILVGNRVTFQYREIDLKTHPEKRQFTYRVAGPSGATLFAAVTKDRQFDWTPQKGGAYTFEVQAIDRDLNYSSPARLTLQVGVPWYANTWITVPGSAAFFGLFIWAIIASAIYVRKSREAARSHERVRIARDLHDHLGAGLTDLALAGDLVRQQIDQPGAAQVLAARLSESARELTRTMGEAIWMIDPEKDTLRSFLSFISSYAERFFAGSELRLRFEFPVGVPELTLPSQLRHSLVMITKEALNNAAKHAQASEVRIKLQLSHHELRLSIEDDGLGFVKNRVAEECRGLANMRQRVCDLGGQLEVESAPGQGSHIHVRVPLPRK